MGTLDEAIKEHLELRRRQGVDENEIQKAEAEAFGPAGDDLPASPMTAPAGEGDQLDKVFSGEGEADNAPPTTVLASGSETISPETSEAEVAVEAEAEVEAPEGDAPVEVSESVEAEAPKVESPPEPPGPPAEPEPPSAPEPAAAAEPVAPPAPEPVDLGDDAADASDMLEAERANLTGHPTENYDVDAAIAEEEELDLLSDSRLSEELDRALGETEAGQPGGLGEPPATEPPAGSGEEVAEVEEVEELPEPNFDIEPADRSGEAESVSPLEETPDFLEESDASDELWFEQGEPKDFDFGD